MLPIFINLSARTHVNELQDLLDSKLEKRRRGVYGPPAGKKSVVFIDDLNMPKKEPAGVMGRRFVRPDSRPGLALHTRLALPR